DLTLPATDAELAAYAKLYQGAGSPQPIFSAREVGGVDDLLKTIERDVKPRIAALAKIDPSDQTLFGHSFGGLAVLRAAFTEPNAFRTFIAASPGMAWNSFAILRGVPGLRKLVEQGKAHPRILLTVGADEPKGWANVVGTARDLASQLQAI